MLFFDLYLGQAFFSERNGFGIDLESNEVLSELFAGNEGRAAASEGFVDNRTRRPGEPSEGYRNSHLGWIYAMIKALELSLRSCGRYPVVSIHAERTTEH